MFNFLADLLPDETGEFFGFSILGGSSYLYIKKLKSELEQQKGFFEESEKNLLKTIQKKEEVFEKQKKELDRKLEANCLSDEAIQFLKSYSEKV